MNQSTETEGSMDTGDLDTQGSWCSQSSAESNLNQNDDSESPFYFESDHLALRGNKDFQKLLSTLALLEAQRMQAAKDLDTLLQAQKDSLKDPIAFVEKLQQKGDIGLPKRQRIAALPNIAWEKYTVNFDPSTLSQSHRTRFRNKTGISRPSSPSSTMSTDVTNGQLSEIIVKSEAGSASSSRAPSPSSQFGGGDGVVNGHGSLVVRGRLKEEHKPETFNVLWTNEEQCRLEELLIKFPPERVEARRWEKIAKALGNRTTQQVASRVQKYFIKLAKAGLPIPGRMPNVNHYVKRSNHRHQRFNRFYFQPSTFMASYDPPVYMSDDEENYSSNNYWPHPMQENDNEVPSDDDEISEEMKSTPEYQEYLNLKQMRKSILKKQSHLGYKCDHCECEPIVGTRWHCIECPAETSVDFCSQCCNSNYEVGTHLASHRLEAVKPVPASGSSFIDNDYTKFMPGDYNYLDPNYMPAV